jgi:hypothetical protein
VDKSNVVDKLNPRLAAQKSQNETARSFRSIQISKSALYDQNNQKRLSRRSHPAACLSIRVGGSSLSGAYNFRCIEMDVSR